MNEYRKNQLKNSWVLIAPNRAKNYHLAIKQLDTPTLKNPFLPGNEEQTPEAIETLGDEEGWRTRVFPNKFPLMNLETTSKTRESKGEEIMGAFGAHEMIIDSREAQKHFFKFSEEDHRFLLQTIQNRIVSLHKDVRIKSNFVYKKQGFLSGGTVPHSNTQLTAFGFIYPELDLEIRESKKFFLDKGRSIYEDMIKRARKHLLVIEENRHFVALIPYAARFEFEVWIVPKFSGSSFANIDKSKIKHLSKITEAVCKKLNIALGEVGFNWSLFSAPAPFEHNEMDYFHKIDEHYRWHIELTPRIKPISGFSTGTGIYVNSVLPEESAEYLRKV